jgi:hypothetical protein
VADVVVVDLDALAWLEKVGEDVVEDLDVRPLAGRVGPRDPHQIPGGMLIPSLYWSMDLPTYLWEPKRFPFFTIPFCWIG